MRGEGEAGEAGIHWSLGRRAAGAEQLLALNVCPEEKIVKSKSDPRCCNYLFKIGSDNDRCIFGRELIKFSSDTKT